MSAQLGEIFYTALQLAFRLHQNQKRKGSGIPYFSHLMAVSAYVLEDGGSEIEAAAALLHDAVEDQGGRQTLEEITRMLGDDVAVIVSACTDADHFPKPPWRQRKEKFIAQLAEASDSALRVIMADKLHNLQTIHQDYHTSGEQVWKIFKGGREGSIWYYSEIIRFFRTRPEGRLRNLLLAEYDTLMITMEKNR